MTVVNEHGGYGFFEEHFACSLLSIWFLNPGSGDQCSTGMKPATSGEVGLNRYKHFVCSRWIWLDMRRFNAQ